MQRLHDVEKLQIGEMPELRIRNAEGAQMAEESKSGPFKSLWEKTLISFCRQI